MNKQKYQTLVKNMGLIALGIGIGTIFIAKENNYRVEQAPTAERIQSLAMDARMPKTYNQRDMEPSNYALPRMTTQNIYLAIKTANVKDIVKHIQEETIKNEGFLVNKNTSQREGIITSYITIRIPREKADILINALKRQKGIEILQEQYNGKDITDQYADLQARLNTLEHTKSIFEKMLNDASNFDQILRAQQEILDTQRQIDNIKGQMKYAEETAKYSLISIDITSDELALGYKPQDNWKPNVVFKRAMRSLIRTIRTTGTVLIWLAVYSPIFLIGYGITKLVRKILKKEKQK